MDTKKVAFLALAISLVSYLGILTLPGYCEQPYPSKMIQIICPYAPGGTSDLTARIVAEKMAEHLKQPVIVVNKPGGGTTLGISFVAKAKPDGYTLLTAPSSFVMPPLLTPNIPYSIDDFVPIARLVTFNRAIVVHKDLPVKNLEELVSYVKKHPKKISYSGAETGGINHLVGALLNIQANTDMQFIPHRGENPAMMALLGGHVQVSVLQVGQMLPHIKTQAVRPIAILNTKRDRRLPDVATCVEQGYPDLVAPSYHTFFAPVKTPQSIVKKLEELLERVLQDKQVVSKLEDLQLDVDFKGSRETQDIIKGESKKWGSVVKKLGIVIK